MRINTLVEYIFRWNAWNIEHVARHHISPLEAEWIIRNARPPYPQEWGEGKYLVVGRLADGTVVQVIYIFDPEDVVYVIHARPSTEREKRNYRRRMR
jgi:uncharacterized DUF497 family protein